MLKFKHNTAMWFSCIATEQMEYAGFWKGVTNYEGNSHEPHPHEAAREARL